MTERDDRIRAALDGALRRHEARKARGSGARADLNHISHARFTLHREPVDGEEGLACLIEPSVRCSGCGFCESLGH